MFEVFVESVFSSTLNRVAHKRRAPTSEDAPDTLSFANLFPRFPVALVEVRVDLTTTLDQIKWSDGRMCCALIRCQCHEHSVDFVRTTYAGKDTSDCACGIVFSRV